MIEDIFSMFFALAGTICVIVLTYYASKWYAKKMGPMAGGKHIKVIDRLAVSKTGSVLIIDVEGTQYMVGVSEHSVQIMKQLEDPIPITMEPIVLNDGPKNFINIFNRWRGVD